MFLLGRGFFRLRRPELILQYKHFDLVKNSSLTVKEIPVSINICINEWTLPHACCVAKFSSKINNFLYMFILFYSLSTQHHASQFLFFVHVYFYFSYLKCFFMTTFYFKLTTTITLLHTLLCIFSLHAYSPLPLQESHSSARPHPHTPSWSVDPPSTEPQWRASFLPD